MTNKDIDSLKLTECQRAKFAVLRMEIPLSVSSRLRTPMETAKFIRESAENPTFELGGLKKEYNCTLPIDALKFLIADLIQYCEEKKISEWLLDDLRTYAKEEVFGRQAEPGHLDIAVRLLTDGGYLTNGNWPKEGDGSKNRWAILALSEVLIEKLELDIDLKIIATEIAGKVGLEVPRSTYQGWEAKMNNPTSTDYKEVKKQFKDKFPAAG